MIQLARARTKEVNTMLEDYEFNFRLELGYSKNPRTLANRDSMVLAFAKHFTVVRVKAQLDQLIEGLNALDV